MTFADRLRLLAVPYGIVGVTLLVLAFSAFHRNGLIARGDLWPGYAIPGNHHLVNALSLWSTSLSGFGSTSFAPDEILPAALCGLLAHIGLPPPLQQFTFFAVLLIFEGIGTAYFVRGLFPERPIVALVAGLALPLSLYGAITSLNYIDAFAIGFFPLAAGWLIRRLREPVSPVRFAAECGLMSLGIMILAGTPPIAAYFLAWAAGWIAAGWIAWRTFRQTAVGLALGVLFALAINSWWAYQVIVTLGGGGAASQTFAGPIEWSWVDRRASLLNLLSMKAMWSLDYGEYAPWFGIYERAPLQELVFAPLFFALVSVLSPYRRRVAALFTVLAVSAFLAKGYHAPFGEANAFLYQHIPFFWLLRDPLVEAGITLYLALFTLAALGLVEVESRIAGMLARAQNRVRQTVEKVAAFALFALLISSGVLFDVGAALPDEWLNGQARSVVDIPQYWYDAAAYLNEHAASERVLIMPNDDFYQMPYDWGYYGADGPPRTLIHAAVVLLTPDTYAYLAISPAARGLLGDLLDSIQSRPTVTTAPALRLAGIGWILQRNDIKTSMPFRHILSASYVAAYLARQPGIHKLISFGKLDVYRVDDPQPYLAAYDGWGKSLSAATPDLVRTGIVLSGDPAWLNEAGYAGAPSARGFSASADEPRLPYRMTRAATLWLTPRSISITAQLIAPQSILVRMRGARVTAGGARFAWSRDMLIPLVSRLSARVAIHVAGDYYVTASHELEKGAPIDIGTYVPPSDAPLIVEVYSLGPNLLATQEWAMLSDCRQPPSDDVVKAAVPLSGGTLRINTGEGSACASIGLHTPRARYDKLLAELEYMNAGGAEPAISFTSKGVSLDDDDLLSSARWHRWHRVVDNVEGPVVLASYAWKTTAGTTINEYRHAGISRMQRIGQRIVTDPDLIAGIGGGVVGTEALKSGANLLRDAAFEHGLWSPVIDDGTRQPLLPDPRRASYSVLPGGVLELRAGTTRISERLTVAGVAGHIVRLHVDARSLNGQGPTALLVGSSGQTLWVSSFHADDSWQSAQVDVHVGSGDDAIGLWLSAGSDYVPSVVQFKNVSLQSWPNHAADVVAAEGRAPDDLPMQWTGNVDHYTAQLPHGTRLFVLRNSFSEGWHVADAGKDLTWRHVTVDGIFNGWIVPAQAPRDVDVYFKPNVLFGRLQALGVVGITLCLVLLCLAALRPRAAGPAFR